MGRSRSRSRSRSRGRDRRSRSKSRGRDREGKIYIGNISSRTRKSDLEYECDRYGRVLSCALMEGFAFVEYERSKDADYAVRKMGGLELDGRRLSVEKSHGKGRGGGGGGGGYSRGDSPVGSGKRGGRVRNRDNCVVVEGLGPRTTWKDLKDFARTAGNVEYADVWFEGNRKLGVMKYQSRSDFKRALKELDDTKLDGEYVRVREDTGSYSSRSRSRSRSPKRSRRSRSKSSSRSRSRSRSASQSRSRSRSRSPKKSSKSRSKSPAAKEEKKE